MPFSFFGGGQLKYSTCYPCIIAVMCYNMDMKTNECEETGRREDAGERNFLRLWREVAQGVFPFLDEEVGELGEKAHLFVAVCEAVVKPESFEYAKWKGNGHPPADRMSIFKAFLFKAVHDVPTTKETI